LPGGEDLTLTYEAQHNLRPQMHPSSYKVVSLQIDIERWLAKMLPTALRRAAVQTPKLDAYVNPYRAKRLWPPDYSKLSPKKKFSLERRYRRRAKLKWARPGWTKAVKLTQLGTIVCEEAHNCVCKETTNLDTSCGHIWRTVFGLEPRKTAF
jgi:hypothetical protein